MSWPLAMVIGVVMGAGLGAITVGLMISAAIEEEKQLRARTYCTAVPPEPPRYRPVPRPVRGVYAWDANEGRARCVWVPEMAETTRPASQRGAR